MTTTQHEPMSTEELRNHIRWRVSLPAVKRDMLERVIAVLYPQQVEVESKEMSTVRAGNWHEGVVPLVRERE